VAIKGLMSHCCENVNACGKGKLSRYLTKVFQKSLATANVCVL